MKKTIIEYWKKMTIDFESGREAITHYEIIEQFKLFAFLKLLYVSTN